MNTIIPALAGLLIVMMTSCNQDPGKEERTNGYTRELKTREDSLFHDVMEGHDLGMAKMGKLNRYIRYTRTAIDSLNKLPKGNPELTGRYSSMLQEFVQADDAMSDWMGNFRLDTLKDNKEAREAYLLSEKIKVEKVRDLILHAEKTGDSAYAKKQ